MHKIDFFWGILFSLKKLTIILRKGFAPAMDQPGHRGHKALNELHTVSNIPRLGFESHITSVLFSSSVFKQMQQDKNMPSFLPDALL